MCYLRVARSRSLLLRPALSSFTLLRSALASWQLQTSSISSLLKLLTSLSLSSSNVLPCPCSASCTHFPYSSSSLFFCTVLASSLAPVLSTSETPKRLYPSQLAAKRSPSEGLIVCDKLSCSGDKNNVCMYSHYTSSSARFYLLIWSRLSSSAELPPPSWRELLLPQYTLGSLLVERSELESVFNSFPCSFSSWWSIQH